MEKTEKILLILLIFLVLILIIPKLNITGKVVLDKYAYTKAICSNSTYCEDYYIECEGENVAGFNPTGFAIETVNAKENSNEKFCG
ncbi:MAG: hypothetical protein NUV46_04305 [Nanoarchaeota archaeon]|nr:hypothetical protein [Nanoarchaeota archaeon]